MTDVYVLPRQRSSDLVRRVGSFVTGLASRVRAALRAVAARIGIRGDLGPPTEIIDDGDDVIILLDIPGVDAGRDVTVEIGDGSLVIAGRRRDAGSREGQTPSGSDLPDGAFRREFTVPAHVSADAVSCPMDSRVLTVRIAGANTETPLEDAETPSEELHV
jgi:HSP20 family molecular chaperone IbpA